MDGKTLSKLFGLNVAVIEKNVEAVTHEESLSRPQPGGNCLNWVLGHITATRNQLMALIGEDPVWSEVETTPYRRGSPPLTDTATALSFARMLTDLRASQKKLLARLEDMSAEELATRVGDQTRFEQLAVLQFHEAYHAGQLGTLRRLLGKPGAIA